MSIVSILARHPALDAGLGFFLPVRAGRKAQPRIKCGATGEGEKLPLTLGGLIESLRRRAPGWSLPARHAAVVQSLPLGPGSRLLVVEFGGRKLLVGHSRAGLSLLSEAQ